MKVTKLTPYNRLGPAPFTKSKQRGKKSKRWKLIDRGLMSEQIANQNHIRAIKGEL